MAQAALSRATAERAAARGRACADYVTLTKPRLELAGAASPPSRPTISPAGTLPLLMMLHTMLGTALVAGGASALNQVWERDTDR